jgi:uncharacterized membrane protein YagU involved in acid resistance
MANFSTWVVRVVMFSSMVGGGLVSKPDMVKIGWELGGSRRRRHRW